MGYSFDSSSDTTGINGQSIDQSIGASSGHHILHVKAWGDRGSACVTDVDIDVQSGSSSLIPSYASIISSLETLSNWKASHDDGGPGWSSGAMSMVSSPSLSGGSRRFVTQYSDGGDERYSLAFSDDTESEHFFYDVWVYLTSSASNIGNIEFDTNQTMPDGKTVMIGVQCDGYTGHWAITYNKGSASNPQPHWASASGTSCNARNWSQYTWHHVQAYYTHNSSGWITYKSVWLDGAEQQMNITAYGAFDLGWGPQVNTQFQVDGLGSSGHTTIYLSNLKISRW